MRAELTQLRAAPQLTGARTKIIVGEVLSEAA